MAIGHRVRFGPFEADLETGEVFHNGNRFVLQEKPLAILALLLRTPGQLVTREEIASKVWPDVFVENDLSLNTAMRRLRAVLEKADPQVQLIETVGGHGYRLKPEVKVSETSDSRPGDTDLRLAVLPFTNLNDDSRDHFCDGLTAQMIVELGHAYKHVSVISPVTSFYFAETAKPLAHIAHRLQADYLLLGTVSRLSSLLRITARLVRGSDQCCVWSESYTRQITDIFLMQDDLTRSISRGLAQALPKPIAAQAHLTTTPVIYEKYLKARFFSYKFVQSSFEKATKLFEQVIAEDAEFAPAYAALAHMLTAAVTYGGPPHRMFYEKIETLANRALELCEEMAETHSALGWLELWRMQCAAAERSFQRATDINPSFALPYIGLGHLFSTLRRHEEAIAAGRRACELDPLSPVTHSMLGLHLYAARQLSEAIECEQNATEIDSSFCPAHAMLGFIYHETGELDQAVLALRSAVQHGPDTPLMKAFLARALAAAGKREEATKILEQLVELRKTNCLPATSIAMIYDALGQREQSWTWLDTAKLELDPWLFGITVDPRFRRFWNDARFPSLLNELGLSHLSTSPLSPIPQNCRSNQPSFSE